jgi:hypothetical protein
MTRFRFHAVVAVSLAAISLACGKKETGEPVKQSAAAVTPPPAHEKPPPPYTYPAPVKGHYREVNVGSFDLVDGVAYTASNGAGTVVYVTDKPIASPVLSESRCPMTQARAISVLRSADYAEVTLDAAGRSKYFAAGKTFGGSTREDEVGGHYWTSSLKSSDAGRAAGGVQHKSHGGFTFDLPLLHPQVREVSEGDRSKGRRADESSPKPTEQALTAAYTSVLDAVRKKDLKSLLAALGFDEKQSAAIRGLDGIEADFAVFSDRFLEPGTVSDFMAKPGTGYVRSEGVNLKGKKFANYYWFAPCGDRLVLVQIAENPQ